MGISAKEEALTPPLSEKPPEEAPDTNLLCATLCDSRRHVLESPTRM